MNRPAVLSFWLCALVSSRVCAPDSPEALGWKTYETPVGPGQHIELAGGGSADLNTDSQLRISTGAQSPALILERGEAFFRSPGKPLHLSVGNLSIDAAKASFSVRTYTSGDVDVMSLDGKIRVALSPAAPPTPAIALTSATSAAPRSPQTWLVPAGQIASAHLGSVSLRKVGRATIQSKLLWRDGMLEFVGEPLENVAAEFNRYSRTRLVIDDESIRNLRVGGRFSAFDLDSLVATVSRVFALQPQPRQTPSGPVVGLRLSRAIPNTIDPRVAAKQ
ncbi:MAG: FecR domain-containing protein [Proteobacteria bacterium]|nr:FecR domain-containing protein [Pseudomonadota bacterium]